MAFNKSDRPDFPKKKGGMRRRKKVCVFCGKDNVIDYKDSNKLRRYISERGKILPRRITGNCALWCFAQFPVILLGRILPLSEIYLLSLLLSL